VQASTRPDVLPQPRGDRRPASPELLAAPELAPKYGAAGRDWMRQSWRWDQRAAQLAGLID
jgi:hypothetical protein